MFRHRLKWLKPYLGWIFVGLIGVGVSGALALAILTRIQPLLALWPNIELASFASLAGLVILRSGFGLLGAYSFGRMAARALTDYRQRLFADLLRAPIQYHDQAWSANLVSALTSDAAFIQEILGRALPVVALHGPAASIALLLLVENNALLLIGLLGLGLPMGLGVYWVGRQMRLLTQRGQQLLSKIAITAQESFLGVRMIKALTREDFFIQRLDQFSEQQFEIKKRVIQWQGMLPNVAPVGIVILAGWATWLARQQLAAEQTNVAALSAFAVYMGILASSVLALIQAYISVEPAVGAFRRLRQINNQLSTAESTAGAQLDQVAGRLRLCGVTFEYANRSAGVYDMDLEIAAGETVALIGQNGAGKSTLIHLLLRFYTPQLGQIYLDDHPADSIALNAWRKQFAVVTRDPVIFNLSVAENIALGKPDAQPAEIEAAARAVQLHEVILKLPHGYASHVGESGGQLSAGQRQRLALARVFLQNPAVVIFDEATASLDRESEAAFAQAMQNWAGKRTILLVSHQPVALWPVSCSIYLEHGHIVRRAIG